MSKILTSLFLMASLFGYSVVRVSTGSGAWNVATTWSPSGVPTSADDLTVSAGHVISIQGTNASCLSLTVDGLLQISDLTANRVIVIGGDLVINPGGIFTVNINSNFTHTLGISGDITNNGEFEAAPDANSLITLNYSQPGTQTISGTGTKFNVRRIFVNKGTGGLSLLNITVSNFSSITGGWLTLQTGSVTIAFPDNITSTVFSVTTTIPSGSTLTIDAPNSNLTFSGSALLVGNLIVQQGILNSASIIPGSSGAASSLTVNGGTVNSGILTVNGNGSFIQNGGIVNVPNGYLNRGTTTLNSGNLNVGNAVNRNFVHESGTLNILGGNVVITGMYRSIVSSVNFNMTAGTLDIASSGNSSTEAVFLLQVAGSTFSMSGGIITINRKAFSGSSCVNFSGLTSSNITGGEIVFGSGTTPSGSIMLVQCPVGLPSIRINSSNVDVRPSVNPLDVRGNITLNSGVLNSNSLNISLTGNWIHSGGTFTPGTTTTVSFTGTNQTLGSSLGTETFNHVVFSNSGTKTLSSPVVARNSSINAGVTLDVSATNLAISCLGNWVCNGTLNPRSGTVTFNGTTTQTLSGTGNDFFGLTINNTSGVNISSGSFRVTDVLTVSNGNFGNIGGTFFLISTSTKTARIAPVAGTGSFSGNFILQRFIAARRAGYHDLGTCVQSSTLLDWDNEMYISGINSCDCPAGITGYDGFAGSFYSVSRYNESVANYWPVKSDTILNPGVGFNLYFGDNAPGTGSTWAAKTLDARGTPFFGNLTMNVFNTGDGFNHLANPYASAVTFGSLVRTNVSSTFFMYNNAGNFVAFNNPATIIPSHQGFYVLATANGSVQFSEAAKSTSTSSNFNRFAEPSDLKIRLSSLDLDLYHDIDLTFSRNSSLDYDFGMDLPYLKSPDPQAPSLVFNVGGKKEVVFNYIPKSEELILPLRSKIRFDGEYLLDFSGIESIGGYEYIYLFDQKLNRFLDLKRNNLYKFIGKMGENPDRFILIFTNSFSSVSGLASSEKLPFYANENISVVYNTLGANIVFDLDRNSKATCKLFNLMGQELESFEVVDAFNQVMPLHVQGLTKGYYILVIDVNGFVYKKKVLLGD